ncbi:biopolymer transporter ExbD [Archangium violaceum]|uniref:ExbD/TolR family protein n=1 Tax=Archangium violaceum TaxID=83451 RepID=UPI00193B5AE4|nr:biopolymer transporter ExbD [Archangium violaceum]QRK08449.1 biopolymer transporter ExbD [Archangium violaceum]
MGMSVGGPSGGPKAEINVTPLVDVVLVLLIIFMVITPMLQRGKSVELPKAREIEKKTDGKDNALILSVTPDKKLYLDNDPLDEKALENRLRGELAKDPARRILLKADNSLRVADVRKVMEVARKAKARRVSLGVEQQKDQP